MLSLHPLQRLHDVLNRERAANRQAWLDSEAPKANSLRNVLVLLLILRSRHRSEVAVSMLGRSANWPHSQRHASSKPMAVNQQSLLPAPDLVRTFSSVTWTQERNLFMIIESWHIHHRRRRAPRPSQTTTKKQQPEQEQEQP